MDLGRPIESVADLFAHALAMEREAVARYREFAQQMLDHDNEDSARLFERLAEVEAQHAEHLERRATGIAVPVLAPAEVAWLDEGGPESPAHEFIFRMMTPRDALNIALLAEERAQEFFEEVLRSATDPGIRALAREMAAEEGEHIAWVKAAIARTPDPNIDWESLFLERGAMLPPGPGVVVPAKSGRKASVAKRPQQPRRRGGAAGAKKRPARKGRTKARSSGAKQTAAKKSAAKKSANPRTKAAAKRKAARPAKKPVKKRR